MVFRIEQEAEFSSNPKIVGMLLARMKEIEKENEQLKIKLRQKCKTIDSMKRDMQKSAEKTATNILRTVFTPGQVKKLISPSSRRIVWTLEDVRSAIALRSVSSKAYVFLREVQKIPLPCIATLKKWVANFSLKPGILREVVRIMDLQGQNLSTPEKLTVLTFDEIYLANKIDLERREQKIYGPHKTCQVVMVRGLFSKWRQPIYYEYSKPMTKEILLEIVAVLYNIGYIVVATTCDMGPTNMSLWKELNIGIETENENKNYVKKTMLLFTPNRQLVKSVYVC